jgi:hypothetical protein
MIKEYEQVESKIEDFSKSTTNKSIDIHNQSLERMMLSHSAHIMRLAILVSEHINFIEDKGNYMLKTARNVDLFIGSVLVFVIYSIAIAEIYPKLLIILVSLAIIVFLYREVYALRSRASRYLIIAELAKAERFDFFNQIATSEESSENFDQRSRDYFKRCHALFNKAEQPLRAC